MNVIVRVLVSLLKLILALILMLSYVGFQKGYVVSDMEKYPGKYCENLNISTSCITKVHLGVVPSDDITNGLVIELLRLRYRLRQQKWEVLNWMQQLYGRKWLQLPQLSMLKKFNLLQSDYRKCVLSKNHQRLQVFLDAPFRLPVASIKNTMSDRHIVEKNFNRLLEDYRAEVLPEVIEGWDSLTEDQKAKVSKMNNFYCGLHFLVALADASSETLKQWEAINSDEDDKSESGTIRLVRTACKAIQTRCCQKAGCHVMFRAYLKTQGIHEFPIATFEGKQV